MIKFTLITLFPEALEPYLNCSMMWKAKKDHLADFSFVNLRDFGLGPHKSVDDTPYGGGDGMLLRCEPVFAAIESVKSSDPSAEVLLPTPRGTLWTQSLARTFADSAKEQNKHYIIFFEIECYTIGCMSFGVNYFKNKWGYFICAFF